MPTKVARKQKIRKQRCKECRGYTFQTDKMTLQLFNEDGNAFNPVAARTCAMANDCLEVTLKVAF